MNSQTESRELLESLTQAIRMDRRFFLLARTDPAFSKVRTLVDKLLAKLMEEAKSKAEAKISSAQSALGNMKAWHAEEAAPSECKSAIDMMGQAKKQFQSDSYFGYSDAEKIAGEAEEEAKSAIDMQRTQLKNKIDTLDSQIGSESYFRNHGLTTTEIVAIGKLRDEALKYSLIESYNNYHKAWSLLQDCLRLSCDMIRKSERSIIEASKQREYNKLNMAILFLVLSAVFSVLFPITLLASQGGNSIFVLFIVLPPLCMAIADSTWNLGKKEPATDFSAGYLWCVFVAHVLFIVAIVWIFKTNSSSREAIENRYREKLERVQRKLAT